MIIVFGLGGNTWSHNLTENANDDKIEMQVTRAEANLLSLIRLTGFGYAKLEIRNNQPWMLTITDLTFRCDLDLAEQGIGMLQ